MGNSARGVEFTKRLVTRFAFHHLDNLRGVAQGPKSEPCVNTLKSNPNSRKLHELNMTTLLNAASSGDLTEISRLIADGMDIYSCNYDKRTALHLAASMLLTFLHCTRISSENFREVYKIWTISHQTQNRVKCSHFYCWLLDHEYVRMTGFAAATTWTGFKTLFLWWFVFLRFPRNVHFSLCSSHIQITSQSIITFNRMVTDWTLVVLSAFSCCVQCKHCCLVRHWTQQKMNTTSCHWDLIFAN